MKFVVEESKKTQKIYPSVSILPRDLKVLGSELAIKIIKELAKKPQSAMDVARRLREHEQKIYYHFRKLEKAKIIELVKTEKRVGTVAKIYKVKSPYLAIKLFDGEFIEEQKTRAREMKFLNPFVENGNLNCLIIVGSPDPHGKFAARASDGYAAIDLALFFGTFVKNPNFFYKLDTQTTKEDLKNNLILIGGPKANIWIEKINKKLPVYFDMVHEFNIVSTITKNTYTDDEIGVVIKMDNPFAKNKKVLILSGRRFKGTRAAIIAVTKYCKKLAKNSEENVARIVKGIDRDSDGIVDDVEFLE
jgi:DNA-binding transcriptional ArsR family regulator